VLVDCVAQVFYVLDPETGKHVVVSGKNIVGVENVEDNDENINQFEEMSLVTNPMNIMHLEKDLRRIFCPICEKVAKKNLHDLFV
jgi:hypothetical protein